MAIASVGTMGTGTSSTSTTTLTLTTATNTLASGDFAILIISADNTSTADGDNSEITSVSGGTGTWTKLGEYTNGNGSAATGVTCGVWLFQATGTVNTGTTITVTFGTARVDKCCSMWKFTKSATANIIKDTQPASNPVSNATDAANGFGSVNFTGLTSSSRLYLRGLAKEANSTTDITVSTNFTAMTLARSRNNAAAVLIRGEFRINTSTGETSNPTLAVTGDTAAAFVALLEVHQGSCTESVTASDSQSAVNVLDASCTETLTATATQDATAGSNISADLTEALSASDLQTVLADLYANLTETLSATEVQTSFVSQDVELIESLTVTDSQSATSDFVVSSSSTLNASDECITDDAEQPLYLGGGYGFDQWEYRHDTDEDALLACGVLG